MSFFKRMWWIVVAINATIAGVVVGVFYFLGPGSKIVDLLAGITRLLPWVAHLSSKSQMGVFAEIYYMMVLPVVPASGLAFYRSMIHDVNGGYSAWAADTFNSTQRAAAIPVGLLLMVVAVVAAFGFEGQSLRYSRIGDSMWAMLTQGWVPLCAIGSVFGFGVSLIRKFFLT